MNKSWSWRQKTHTHTHKGSPQFDINPWTRWKWWMVFVVLMEIKIHIPLLCYSALPAPTRNCGSMFLFQDNKKEVTPTPWLTKEMDSGALLCPTLVMTPGYTKYSKTFLCSVLIRTSPAQSRPEAHINNTHVTYELTDIEYEIRDLYQTCQMYIEGII